MLPEEKWGTIALTCLRAEEIKNVHMGFIVDKNVVFVIYFCDLHNIAHFTCVES